MQYNNEIHDQILKKNFYLREKLNETIKKNNFYLNPSDFLEEGDSLIYENKKFFLIEYLVEGELTYKIGRRVHISYDRLKYSKWRIMVNHRTCFYEQPPSNGYAVIYYLNKYLNEPGYSRASKNMIDFINTHYPIISKKYIHAQYYWDKIKKMDSSSIDAILQKNAFSSTKDYLNYLLESI